MNRLLLAVLAASLGLSACSKQQEAAAPAPAATPAAPAAPASQTTPPSLSASTPYTGKVLQSLPAAGYTYAEVETEDGKKVWIAGGPIQVKPGDTVQWGNYSVMQNFNSKSLNRTFEQILFVNTWGPVGGGTAQVAPHGNMAAHSAAVAAAPAGQPAAADAGTGSGQGEVKSVAAAGGYTYLEISQGGNVIWLAAPETAVKAGDKVNWGQGMVMRNFTAKSLGRTFDQILFTDGVKVVR